MRGVIAATMLVSCARSTEPARTVDVPALRAQLSKVARPEPNGLVIVRHAASTAGVVHVERGGQPGVSVDLRAIDVDDVRFDERTHAARVGDLEIAHLASGGRFEELRRLHRATETIELRYAIALGPALARLRVGGEIVEALDGDGVARLRTEPAFAVDARGVVRALHPRSTAEGVTWSADAADLVPPIAIDPAWTTTASTANGRRVAVAFTLPGKKVMLAGGLDPHSSAEIYDDATASWTTTASMLHERQFSYPVRLEDGRIFVAGGVPTETNASGEIYDPAKDTWTAIATAPLILRAPAIAPLKGNRAIVSARGGTAIYAAATNTWTITSNPAVPRVRCHSTALLPDGRAFIVGGADASEQLVSAAEVYDPATAKWSSAGVAPRFSGSTNIGVLTDGHVVVVGGADADTGAAFDAIGIWDPVTNAWTDGPKLNVARAYPGIGRTDDGRLIIAGGQSAASLLDSAEILDFAAKKWILAGRIHEARTDFPIVPIAAGDPRVLAATGYNGALSTAVDVFDPQGLGKPCAADGECGSLHCVDAVCCATAACAADQTCGSDGSCKSKNAQKCGDDAACASGHCVDGVCCDRACTGSCEACDVASSPGACTTLAPGESPHGSARAPCAGEGECRALCGGVDGETCTLFPGATTPCGAAICKGGKESPRSTCDGAGACTKPPSRTCEPFACGETACRRACAADTDCAEGYSCDSRSGRCVFGAKCDGDHTVTARDAAPIDCTPFRCAGATCLHKCASTDDCVTGTICDTATDSCVVAAGEDAGGGCAMGRRPVRTVGALASLLLLLGLARRRR
jgi:hypothetical protein